MSSKTRLPGETDRNPPTDNGPLQAQGVNVLTVLTACKANRLDSPWDQAAYVLLNQSVFGQVVRAPYPDLALSASTQAVGACLADAQTRPACLELFRVVNQSGLRVIPPMIPEVYWSYQDVKPSSSSPYRDVDACQVFTGPAENPQLSPTLPVQATFQACDQYPAAQLPAVRVSGAQQLVGAGISTDTQCKIVIIVRGSIILSLQKTQLPAPPGPGPGPFCLEQNDELTTLELSRGFTLLQLEEPLISQYRALQFV